MRRLLLLVLLGFCPLLTFPSTAADPTISEFMPDNARILTDEDGNFQDWIEIYNPDSIPRSLAGYFLTDHPAQLQKWAFPPVVLASDAYLVVFASGKNRINPTTPLHTSFQLDANGGFLALVKPDGVTIASEFNYPAVREDVSYGSAQTVVVTSLLANAVPQILVPTNAMDLPPDWNAVTAPVNPAYLVGVAPPTIGFDTNTPAASPLNLAPGGIAVQSTTAGSSAATAAVNGSTNDYTQTLNTDTAPFWQVTLGSEAGLRRIVLRNRASCCGSRLRDIIVEILGTDGVSTNFTTGLLNPENAGYAFPNGPAFIEIDLISLTGNPVFGRIVRVSRIADSDLSGSAGQGGTDEQATLSLAEVEVIGVPVTAAASEINLARTGIPLPTATQSTTQGSFTPNMALDGNLGNFTHTTAADPSPAWTLNLGRRALIRSIAIHNRTSCCGSRLRDITVEILGPDAVTVVYTSSLLNPENAGFTFPSGPARLDLDVSASSVLGQYVRIRRTIDPDLSGTGGQGNTDEAAVLSLGEVEVRGLDLNGLRPFIRTDLETAMLAKNPSAFARLPFSATNSTNLQALTLNARYDDAFIAYLNGVEVARRNVSGTPAWNGSADSNRSLANALQAEPINLNGAIHHLAEGANVLAVQILNSSSNDPELLFQAELLATRLQTTANVFLSDATPGARNNSDYYAAEVADTQFSVDRGFFETPFSLVITSATPDAVIYYSFNGDEPGPTKGLVYTGPIFITNSTVLRARAFKAGWKESDIDTHTYLFLGDVIHQAPNWPLNNVPPPFFPASWGRNTVDYGMDPNVVANYSPAQWTAALTQVPTMSVVTEMPNLFDATTGIYANADGHGEVWERPASLELLDPTNSVPGRFQEDCGLRIRGGASRGSGFRKHSFRVFFRREYGAGKLNYPLFENEGASEFETFDLRTSQNYSWPRETSVSAGEHDTMVREVFARETLGAMGQPYRRSRYYHLYLNGQYWGLYETDERPEASYGQTYFGGSKTNFDVVKCGNRGTSPNFATEATDGNLLAFSNLWTMCRAVAANPSASNYFRVLGRHPDGSRNTSLPVMLDVDNLIDYMLGIFYTGDGDAPLSSFLANNLPNNWFGMRDRTNPDVGFRFFNSDCEHTLGSPNSQVDRTGPFRGVSGSNIGVFLYANPQYLHEDLMWSGEYRQLFADHVHKHFFNGGALTVQSATNRFLRKASQINQAIRAYSARWGDAAPHEPPYGETEWVNRINTIVNTWFPPRNDIVLAQLRGDGLFSTLSAPEFGLAGGAVPEGYALDMFHTNALGAVYYTIDGSDPRSVGGGVSAAAQSYSSPLIINAPTLLRARVLTGTNWSAILQHTFFPPQDLSKLLITEIMYHPPLLQGVDGDEYEFLELKNAGTNTLTLSGLRFSGIGFVFTNGTTLGPGQFFVLARNAQRFAAKYPGVAINGVFSGGLANGGESLTLSHPLGGKVIEVSYGDLAPWPVTPDGFGFSLVPVSPNSNPDAEAALAWRASSLPGGSPGADDPMTVPIPVFISEVLSHSETGADFIELFNPTTNAVDLGGWFLTDDPELPMKFRIPDDTILEPSAYLLLDEDDFNPTNAQAGFSLRARGDDVYLFSGDGQTNLTGYSHGFAFEASPDGATFGRYVISTGEEHFPEQITATSGQPNSGPRIGPVVINEIMYHPDAGGDEFIELRNITTNAIAFHDADRPTNTWELGGTGFTFPTNVVLNPHGFLLVVSIDPDAFRAKYQVPPDVLILGPYPGELQDRGERLALRRPDVPDTDGVPFVIVDEVRYNDRDPWSAAADGSGPSLQRKNSSSYGNDPANWDAAIATPGTVFAGGDSPTILAQPSNQSVLAGATVVMTVSASGQGPLNFQWRHNGEILDGQTSSNLLLNSVQASQAGSYSVLVFNAAGSAASAVASLTVRQPPVFLSLPALQAVRPGSNALFQVSARGNGLLRYQWNLNGVPLSGATNASLLIVNSTFAQEGEYTVTVTDNIGPATSPPVPLIILVDPIIVQHPIGQPVIAGGSVTLSLTVTNTATLPVGYRLRRNAVNQADTHIALNSRTVYFTITNLQLPFTNWAIVATNMARPSGNLSTTATLTFLVDSDSDSIPDDWESIHGFDPNDIADASLDVDGDTMLNWEEYIAGTDPTNAASYLKVEAVTPGIGTTVQFAAVSNRTYTVQFNDDLAANPWSKLTDVVPARTNRQVTVFDPAASPGRYYRLVTPRIP